jgi:hypothetical protein
MSVIWFIPVAVAWRELRAGGLIGEALARLEGDALCKLGDIALDRLGVLKKLAPGVMTKLVAGAVGMLGALMKLDAESLRTL